MKLYLRTTTDKYELPIAVATNPAELARMVGTTSNSVSSLIAHNIKGWYRIEVEEDENDECEAE